MRAKKEKPTRGINWMTVVVRCASCRQKFERVNRVEYGWRIKDNLFCSYKCMRDYEARLAQRPVKMREKRMIDKQLNDKRAVE